MILPDVILSWPRNTDYPLYRQFLHDNRDKFDKVIIVFTETNQGVNYKEFIKMAMSQDNILFLDSPPVDGRQDWRDVAVNFALQHSTAKWVWFTEQDFTPLDNFWGQVAMGMEKEVDVIGVKDGERLHPCCLFMTRSAINLTSRYFGIVPNKSDHFSIIAKDIEAQEFEWLLIPEHMYTHMAGLSHNFRLVADGQLPNHKIEEFKKYVIESYQVLVPLAPSWCAMIAAQEEFFVH
jgi:hypothetical protein